MSIPTEVSIFSVFSNSQEKIFDLDKVNAVSRRTILLTLLLNSPLLPILMDIRAPSPGQLGGLELRRGHGAGAAFWMSAG
jgi:hypothetical protein